MTGWSFDPERLDILVGQLVFGFKIQKGAAHQFPDSCEPDVLTDSHRNHQALPLAILWCIRNSKFDRLFRPGNLDRSSIYFNRSRFRRSYAENGLGQLRPPGADQPSEPYN